MKRIIRRMVRLSVLALVVGYAGVAAAQSVGSTVAGFNILGNTQVTLTGVGSSFLYVRVAGVAPNTAITLTNARVGTQHLDDTTAVTGQSEARDLDTSLSAPIGATVVTEPGALAVPTAITVGGGITVIQFDAGASITNNSNTIYLTGDASSIVIFRVPVALTFTDVNVVLSGILPGNVYWQVGTDVTLKNNAAAGLTLPGTVISETSVNTGAIAVTASGAGSYSIGRLIALAGGVTVTQSGAGALAVVNPTSGTGAGPVTGPGTDGICGADFFFPSPAVGPTGNFAYCMIGSGHAIIKVYNAVGDIVAKLNDYTPVCMVTATGAYACLSALNTARLAPGVYLYRIEKYYDAGNSNISGVMKFGVRH